MSNREGAVCPEMSNRFPNQLLMWKIFVLLCGVSASAYADRVSVSVEVRDEEGLLISNAVVSVSTQKLMIMAQPMGGTIQKSTGLFWFGRNFC